MKYLMIAVTLIICSCQNESSSNVAVEKKTNDDNKTKYLQDKYVSNDPSINHLRKRFDELLFKHDSLTGYISAVEVRFETESSNIRKIKQKINLLLLRETMTNDEKYIVDSLLKDMDVMVDDLKRKAAK